MNKCPICGGEVEQYHELTFKEPYVHNIPWDGLMIYGAYTAPKATICYENNFFHFAFYDAGGQLVDHRLVQLGVENPTTKSPSEEYMESLPDEGYEDDEEDSWDTEEDDYDDNWFGYGPEEEEEFPNGSLDY